MGIELFVVPNQQKASSPVSLGDVSDRIDGFWYWEGGVEEDREALCGAQKASGSAELEACPERVDEAEFCGVCLLEFEEGDELRTLLPCGHRFHRECIDNWL